MPRADISLLFDFFVTSQRLRRHLTDALAEAGMRPDEYAVYSLLLDEGPLTASQMAEMLGMPLTTLLDYVKALDRAGHLVRTSHPFDGRAVELSLSRSGLAAQRRANRHWEVARKGIEHGLDVPLDQVRRSLHALDESARRAMVRQRRAQVSRSSRG
ncbi:MAG TPA: MarR family winged helix-turn-helix transcriptional regulator [Candidatus Dormibacteraeota bacterium]|nr:MarR family winged helix-turn-helix transcriptional regulator [Candidatus Dormibacteraeota bacterium]